MTTVFLNQSIPRPTYIPMTAWLRHGPFAMWLVQAARPRTIVELGSHYGYSYFAFCQAVTSASLPTRCIAVDTWQGDEHAGFYGEDVFETVRAQNQPYEGFSTLLRKTFAEALADVEDGSVDVLHVDGRHFYGDVKEDYESWIPKLSDRAVVLFHDTEVRERGFGVWRYWEELAQAHPVFNFPYQHGLGVLFRGQDLSPEMGAFRHLVQDEAGRDAVTALFAAQGEALAADHTLNELAAKAANGPDALSELLTILDSGELVPESQLRALDAGAQSLSNALLAQASQARDRSNQIEALEAQLAAMSEAKNMLASRVEKIPFHQAATVNGLVRQLNQLNSVIERPVLSRLVSRAAILAANLPGLSERRRKKLRNSSRKRNLEVLTKSFGTALRTLQANSVARSGQVKESHDFLGNDLDGRPIVGAVTDLDVDIVVCIHNALEDVKACLSSIVANTRPPYRLILVDDGSRDDTKQYLENFAAAQGATLLRSDRAGGYTWAANRGLRASSAPWTVLLNSDTIVPFGWIDELLKIGESDEKIGIVGPSSNTASWQSAPLLFNEDGDWADNPLLPNVDVQDMQRLVSSVAPPQGIDLPFLNGFAFMIRRPLIDDIGIFDEETFGAGYGEENDLCIRARQAGWKLIFAPNAYVFHAQSKSYSTEKRLKLAAAAHANLCAKHDPDQHIMPQVQYCKDSLATLSFRARLATMLEDTTQPEVPWEGKRLAVLCPIGSAGGGGNILVQESLLMAQLGAQVWLLNMETNQTEFERNYPERSPTLYFTNGRELKAFLHKNELNFDAVIATACFSTNWVPDRFDGKSPKLGYYIQDDEPKFFKKSSPEYQAAIDTYKFLDRACGFTKTNWNADAIEKRGFPRPAVIGTSVDLSRFRPKGRDLNPHRPIRLAAMLRFESEIVDRRAPDRTMRIFNRLAAAYGASVDLIVFGSDLGDDRKSGLAEGVIDLGRLRPDEVAILMRNVDVFLDFSMWQAMGLSAMEAMASGCTVVVPRNGGAVDFCVDGHNGLIVDSEDDDACFAAASRLIDDPDFLAKLRKNATQDICQFTQQRSARRILELLFGPAR